MFSGKVGGRWRRFVGIIVGCGAALALHASESTPTSRDTLVYKDGDRVQGALVETKDGAIVFQSDRFGSLHVPAADAVVIKAEEAPKPAATPVAELAATPEDAAANQREAERVSIWDHFSSGVLTARVRDFFGPWHGRLAFSTEVVSDTAERNNQSFEAKLTRKWEHDEVQATGRYDYARTNDVLTTDLLKGSGWWRHEFQREFVQYRPSGEWNRASTRKDGPAEYVLLQQELGVGYSLLTSPARKVRFGVSHNLFDYWSIKPPGEHTSHGVPSAFEEVELRLPWRMGLTQRGAWYPSRSRPQGWENQIELNKKLTETLSTSVRHEIRRDNPDGSAPDYTRLKLLFGFDF